MAIFNQIPFGHLDNENNIVYFAPYKGGLKTYYYKNGKKYIKVITNPTETEMNNEGWYRVVNVADDGTDVVVDNVLYHYTGAVDDEPIEEEPEGEE